MAKHPHAELIKQMVDDDSLRATYGKDDGRLCQVVSVVANPDFDWRLVPPKPKTITIVCNGKTYELPEPMRVAPKYDSEYYIITTSEEIEKCVCNSSSIEMQWLKAGICHATREAAQQWVDAMAEIRGAK